MCHFVKNLSPFSFLYFLKSMVPVPGSPVPSVSPVAPVYTLDGVVDSVLTQCHFRSQSKNPGIRNLGNRISQPRFQRKIVQ